MSYKEENENLTGFKFQTDVWEQFTEAEKSEINEEVIEELYRKLFREWHNDVKMVTELSMCLNWKLHEHYNLWEEDLARCYSDLWVKVHEYAKDVFEWDDASYYYRVTD